MKPTSKELRSDEIVLRRLKYHPELQDSFVEAVLRSIQNDYDEITPRFAHNLIAIDRNGVDPNGYFTLGKEVWVAFNAMTNDFIGFEVITRKRGGSIKLGPTFVSPDQRGSQYARKMIDLLLHEYVKCGARKVYVTAPLSNDATAVLDYAQLGLKLEAILSDHYKQGSAERICGKILVATDSLPFRPFVGFSNQVPLDCIEGLEHLERRELQDFVMKQMHQAYDEIDKKFVAALYAASIKPRGTYEEKIKRVWALSAGGKLVGLAAATPKRGGAYKIAPLLIDPAYRSERALQLLVGAVHDAAERESRTKIYAVIPVIDVNITQFLAGSGYVAEGILREPYKPGMDAIVFSKKVIS